MVARFKKYVGDPKSAEDILKEALPKAILISALEKELKLKPFEVPANK